MSAVVRPPATHALTVRNFRRYLLGQLVSNIGTWMQRAAQDLLVLHITGDSGSAVGIVTALQFLPGTLLGLAGGVLADRYPKRRTLLLTQTAMAAQSLLLGLLTVTGAVNLPSLYALALVLGAATAVDGPARNAYIGELVSREHTAGAVSLNAAQFNVARAVGPALAGLAVAAFGSGPVFLLNTASYLVVLYGLIAVRSDAPDAPARARPGPARVSEALRHIAATPDLLLPIGLVAFVGTFGLNFQVTISLVAVTVFHTGAAAFGWLSAAYALGGLVGALYWAHHGKPPTRRRLTSTAIGFGALEVAQGLMPDYGSFLLLLFLTGCAAVTVTTTANALIQLHADPPLRGRVLSVYFLVLLGGTPVGAPLVGLVSDTLGARFTLVLGGAVSLVAALALAVRARGRGRRAPGAGAASRPRPRGRLRARRRSTLLLRHVGAAGGVSAPRQAPRAHFVGCLPAPTGTGADRGVARMSEHRRRPSGRTAPPGPDAPHHGGRAAARRAARSGEGRARRAAGTRHADAGHPRRRSLIDYPRAGRRGLRRWLPSWKLVSGTFLLFAAGLLGLFGYAYATTTIPSANPSTQAQSNTYYWSDGSVMTTQGATNRQNVDLAQVPKLVQWDFLAAENATFYTDPGVDTRGMLRAVYHMATGGEVQSGSTITQQFVKNTYLSQDQSVTRKLREIMISLKIGGQLSKQQILQGYLNTCYYGRDAYGIEAAARTYYHVHAFQLNVSQGAFIAATVNEPSLLMHADTDPQAKAQAKARWTYVLDRMAKIHKITAAQEQQYLAAGFPTPKPYTPSAGMDGQTGYLVQAAEKYVEAHTSLTDQQLGHGGYQIYTTFDKKRVGALSASVAAMERKHLDPKHRTADKDVQVGAASIDPSTGALVALYGGPGWNKGHWTDNADATGVPVGSTFKPLDLAAALDHGAVLSPGQPASPITPDSKFDGDDGITIKNQQGQELPDAKDPTGLLHQRNDVTTKWGYITLRKAMEQSVNTPYVQLGEYVGYDAVEAEALKAGLLRPSLQYDTPGFYIGTSTPSAIRMADAYATFDDGGVQHEPYSVTKVVADGRQLPGFDKPKGTMAMPASTADTVTDVLRDVVKNGTGTNAQALGRPAAGKTGTTDDYKSAWFIGYTPQLTTAVSMFKEDPKNAGLQSMQGVGGYAKVFGADMPTEVWTGYMTAALRGQPVQQFPPAPALGQSTDEYGAPSPTPSATVAPSTPPATPTTPPTPTPTTAPCRGHGRHCVSPSPTDTTGSGGATGGGTGGGLFGGTTGGTTGGTSPSPAPTSTTPVPGRGRG